MITISNPPTTADEALFGGCAGAGVQFHNYHLQKIMNFLRYRSKTRRKIGRRGLQNAIQKYRHYHENGLLESWEVEKHVRERKIGGKRYPKFDQGRTRTFIGRFTCNCAEHIVTVSSKGTSINNARFNWWRNVKERNATNEYFKDCARCYEKGTALHYFKNWMADSPAQRLAIRAKKRRDIHMLAMQEIEERKATRDYFTNIMREHRRVATARAASLGVVEKPISPRPGVPSSLIASGAIKPVRREQ